MFHKIFKFLIAAKCGPNEIFANRVSCPRTCLDTQGKKWCGVRVPREGCYCSDGFVRNSAGQCIRPVECGCRLPNNRGLVAVGQSFISRDCTKRFTCNGPQQIASVQMLPKCSTNARCSGDSNRVSKCFCKKGFIGDGYKCEKGKICFNFV